MIERLVRVLEAARLDLTAEDIADALWLARLMGEGEPLPAREPVRPEPGGQDAQGATGKTPLQQPTPPPQQGPQVKPAPASTEPRAPLELPGSDAATRSAVSFKVPAAAALPRALELGRALRPLHRRVPSRKSLVIDETASAEQIAETGIWAPVLRPAQSRWFDLALVVDAGASMAIWRRTLVEFRDLLQFHGAFSNVRVWRLATDASGGDLVLRAGLEEGAGALEATSPQTLVDARGRRLVLVVSDCVSRRWHTGEVGALLAEWGRAGPVAVVQLLPEGLWGRTALRNGAGLVLRTRQPGAPNTKLWVTQAQRRPRAASVGQGPVVPVVPLEPSMLAAWARLVAGGSVAVRGFELRPATSLPASLGGERPAPPAKERVERFLATASPPARKLAGLLAASPPVNLPVLRLIRQTLVPEADHGHIAEVFLSGLLRELPGQDAALAPDARQYDFWPGVRERLLEGVPAGSARSVLLQVSGFIESRMGQASDFPALLVDPTKDTAPFVEQHRAFASIAAHVLQRLGGDYADLARRLREADQRADQGPREAGRGEKAGAAVGAVPQPSEVEGAAGAQDWALVVGAAQSPGDTAERDARAFHEWLVSPSGGRLPREQAALFISPMLAEVEKWLRLLMEKGHDKPEGVPLGRRLYIFATGPCLRRETVLLLLPGSSPRTPDLFGARGYATWFSVQHVFSEVVLFMDCEPTTTDPDYFNLVRGPPLPLNPKGLHSSRRLLAGYAGNPDDSRKQRLGGDTFTRAVLAGLSGGAADSRGIVTADGLMRYVSSRARASGLPAPEFEQDQQEAVGPFILTRVKHRLTPVRIQFHPIYRGLRARIFTEHNDNVASTTVQETSWEVELPPGYYTLGLSANAVAMRRLEVAEQPKTEEFTWEPPDQWVLVAGSGKERLSYLESQLCSALGVSLALAGYRLITGDQPGVDAEVMRAFGYRIALWEPSAIQELPVMDLPDPDVFRGIRVVQDSEGYEMALRRADVVVLIGGHRGVRKLYRTLQMRNKVVIPVPSVGGESQRIFEHIWEDSDEQARKRLEPLRIPVGTLKQAETMAERLVRVIRELPLHRVLPPDERWSWAGPEQERLRQLAAEYEELSTRLPLGHDRTLRLNEIIDHVHVRAYAKSIDVSANGISRLLVDASPGERIVVLGLLLSPDSPVCFREVLQILAQSLSPFEHDVARRVMQVTLERLSPEELLSLQQTLAELERNNAPDVREDSSSQVKVNETLSESDNRRADSPRGEDSEALARVSQWFEASMARWHALADQLPPDHSARLDHGHYAVGYQIVGDIQIKEGEALREALEQGAVRHTGWPPFWVPTRPEIAPYMFDNILECWLGREGRHPEPADSDFWRAAPQGLFFLLRGYEEDGLYEEAKERIPPGRVFDISLPTWRIGEILLHAASMARQFGAPQARILFIAEWTGLGSRKLTSLSNQYRVVSGEAFARRDLYRASITAQADQISDTLQGLVQRILRPLYALFGVEVPETHVAEELASMRSSTAASSFKK